MSKFISSALSVEVRAFDGSVLTKENIRLYAAESEGYCALTKNKKEAVAFKTEKEALLYLAKCDGKPWFNRLKHGTAVVEDVSQEIGRLSHSELVGELERIRSSLSTARSEGIREGLEMGANIAYRTCAETRHVTLGDKCQAAIRAKIEEVKL